MNCAEDNNPSAAQQFVELTVRIADPRPCRELRRLHPPDIKAPARTRRRQECLHYLFLRCDPGPAGRARGWPIARVAAISPVMADPARNGPGCAGGSGRPLPATTTPSRPPTAWCFPRWLPYM